MFSKMSMGISDFVSGDEQTTKHDSTYTADNVWKASYIHIGTVLSDIFQPCPTRCLHISAKPLRLIETMSRSTGENTWITV